MMDGPKTHPSQQNAAPDVRPKPTLGSRGRGGKRGRSQGHNGRCGFSSNNIDCFLQPFTAYMSIGLPMIAGLVPFGLPFTNSKTFLVICLLCTLLVFAIRWYSSSSSSTSSTGSLI